MSLFGHFSSKYIPRYIESEVRSDLLPFLVPEYSMKLPRMAGGDDWTGGQGSGQVFDRCGMNGMVSYIDDHEY